MELTLKAFANFSPGLCFGNPGKEARHFPEEANPERVASLQRTCSNSFRVATRPTILTQGFKANPGLQLANAFGVKFKPH
jgi:hypothetical protein